MATLRIVGLAGALGLLVAGTAGACGGDEARTHESSSSGGGEAGAGGQAEGGAAQGGNGAGGAPVQNVCSPPCQGKSCCAGSCVELAGDEGNCGTCGKGCGAGEKCIAGACGPCTPSCEGKECGSDGCEAECGKCEAEQVCQVSACVACTPKCDGKACGPDGCGGECGKCAGNTICVDGSCVDPGGCQPKCGGALCGDDDSCGGKCDGSCPGGGACQNGACGPQCQPSCAGKQCGNDGCGGKCGACAWPQTCSGGKCACQSLCNIEGRQCGPDGCGGSCGECTGGKVCADEASGAPQPTYQCLDQSLGCSDGTREGFKDAGKYPEIASCAAAFPEQSLRVSRTGKWCGNSLGPCEVPEDACSPGWHICMRNGWPGDLGDRVSGEDCGSPQAGPGVYATASNAFVGYPPCGYTPPMPCTDQKDNWGTKYGPVACGQAVDKSWECKNLVWKGLTYMTPHAKGSCLLYKNSEPADGVLCCQDPPVVGQ
ncbi:MAG: hypothetical protein HY744_29930 [Deltaproteobacteria bacterium]|nr:hypothetical protein [Deltaproteobacteria bacterium]